MTCRLALVVGFLLGVGVARADGLPTTATLTAEFGSRVGTAAFFDSESGRWTFHEEGRARQRFSPCSTFKIPNSLIGLEAGAVQDAGTTLTWDRVPRSRPEENRNHILRSAFQQSIVWYYQEIARRVGEEQMTRFLRDFDYGNQSTSGGLTRFWLGSGLEISAVEQVEFLRRLEGGSLPVSARSRAIVLEIMEVQRGPGYVLRGKTGSRGRSGGGYDLGWFVGWVELVGRRPVFFAVNVEGEGAWGPAARDLVRSVFATSGILPYSTATPSR
jgi:beta-lactamase class D